MAEARCYCGTNCTGCGDCRHWGNYSCYCGTNCSGCSGCSGCSSCSGTCTGTCQGGCSNSCTGTCKGGCSNSCTGTCKGSCSGSCSGSCKGNCGRGCNTGCNSTEALNLYNKLVAGLNQVIYAADMVNINRMIEIEAGVNRKNVSITSVAFTAGDAATSAQIKQLQSNLSKIGQATTKSANVGDSIAATTGNELITKVLASADTKLTT